MKTDTLSNGSVVADEPAPSATANTVEASWRAASFQHLLEFSQKLSPVMRVSPDRLRVLFATGNIRDRALREAMGSMHLNFDRVLIIIGGFIRGEAYALPDSESLRAEITALCKLGVVQEARSGPSGGWSGLTEQGRQFAVYLIYRIMVAAADTGGGQ
jgi:hypothetical protein